MPINNPFLLQHLQDPRNPPPFSLQPTLVPFAPQHQTEGLFFFEIPASYAPLPQFLHFPASYPAHQLPASNVLQLPAQAPPTLPICQPIARGTDHLTQPVVSAHHQEQTQVNLPPAVLEYLRQQGLIIVRQQPQVAQPHVAAQVRQTSLSGSHLPHPSDQSETPAAVPGPHPCTPQQHFLQDLLHRNASVSASPTKKPEQPLDRVDQPIPEAKHIELRARPAQRRRRRKDVLAAADAAQRETYKRAYERAQREQLSFAQSANERRARSQLVPSPHQQHAVPPLQPSDLPIAHDSPSKLKPNEPSRIPDDSVGLLGESCAQSLEHLANALCIDSWFPKAAAAPQQLKQENLQMVQSSSSSLHQSLGPASSSSTSIVSRPVIHSNRNVQLNMVQRPLLHQPLQAAGGYFLPLPPLPASTQNSLLAATPSLPSRTAAADKIFTIQSQPPNISIPSSRSLGSRQRAPPANRTPAERDRRNAAQRRYYEKRKKDAGKGPVRKFAVLTDEQKRARQAAIGRAWRVRNYVKVLTVVRPTDATSSPKEHSIPNKYAGDRNPRKKSAEARSRGRPRLTMTEEERRARQAANSRAWRARNYIRCLGVNKPAGGSANETFCTQTLLNIKREPADFEQQCVSQQIKNGILIMRNIKREPVDFTEQHNEFDNQAMCNADRGTVSYANDESCEAEMSSAGETEPKGHVAVLLRLPGQAQSISYVVEQANSGEAFESVVRNPRSSSAFSDEM